jgi:hypothetical protein
MGQHRGFIEAKLKLRRISKYLDDNRLKIIGDPITQLHLAIDITETFKHIDRYEQLLPEEGARTAKANQTTKKSNYERQVTKQIQDLESGIVQSRALIFLISCIRLCTRHKGTFAAKDFHFRDNWVVVQEHGQLAI